MHILGGREIFYRMLEHQADQIRKLDFEEFHSEKQKCCNLCYINTWEQFLFRYK